MKIRVYGLAFDGENVGTDLFMTQNERELYEVLVDWLFREDDVKGRFMALKCYDNKDFDYLDELLRDAAANRLATWHISYIDVEVS